jgi:uncharacterized SAM-binding protein YcdF (DUF218 family)
MSSRLTRRLVELGASLLLALILFWLVGLWRFAASMPNEIADPDEPTDAIVVLTGGRLRLESGLRLLFAGKAKKLFVSGVHPGVEILELLRAAHQPLDLDNATCCIELGHSADNTVGNARETAAWMKAHDFHSLRLVTANYHMARSLVEFARAMPDVEIVPNPVFPEILEARDWWRSPAAINLVVVEYNKYLVTLMRPLVPSALIPQGLAE